MAHFTIMAPPFIRHVRALEALAADDVRPFVFALLGMLQGARLGLFRHIARACRALDAQLLLAHCDCLNTAQAEAPRHAGVTWGTGFAPQRTALARADVVISHAGLNTVLDARASAARIEKSLRRLLGEPAFTQRVRLLGTAVVVSGGVPRMVGLIEAALVSTAPCPLFFIPKKEPAYAAPTAAAAQAARRQHA